MRLKEGLMGDIVGGNRWFSWLLDRYYHSWGDANDNRDIDLLIEPAKKSLFELAGIKIDLERALDKEFDVLTYNGLNYSRDTKFKERVLEEHMIII